MYEHIGPAHTNKKEILIEKIQYLVNRQLELHGAVCNAHEDCLKDCETYLGKVENALEEYVQVRVFIALRKYIYENTKAA